MKKLIAIMLSAVMLMCSFSVGAFAVNDLWVEKASVYIDKPVMADFDCYLIDYNHQTYEECEPFYFYDIYDFRPYVNMEFYKDGNYYTLDCGLDEVYLYTGLQVSVSSDQSPDNQWGAGEHYYNIKIGDYETVAVLDISENIINSIKISGERQLTVTVEYQDGGEYVYTPVYFADVTGVPGNSFGYMYMKDGDRLPCTAMYDADIYDDGESYTFDETKNLSFSFGKNKTNAIDSVWLKYSGEQQDVISEFTMLVPGEFNSASCDISDKNTVQGVLLSYAYRATDEKTNGVDVNYDTSGGGVSVSAPADVVKDAFNAVLGVEIDDVSAVAGYNKKTDCVEPSGAVYDYMCYWTVDDIYYSSDSCVLTYTVYRITDNGDIADEKGETRYALFDKNNALVSISEAFPEGVKETVVKVMTGFDNITVDNDRKMILVRPESTAGMYAGALTAAMEPQGIIDCDPEEKAGTGMTIMFGLDKYTVIVMGDADSNGKITPADARAALRIAARLDESTDNQKSALDLDGNGKVSPGEARQILRFAARLDDKL